MNIHLCNIAMDNTIFSYDETNHPLQGNECKLFRHVVFSLQYCFNFLIAF
jgi:hypothetical protein